MVLAAQLVLVTPAVCVRPLRVSGRNIIFALVLVQLMIMPDVLIVEATGR